jgi:hypothetical protein
MTSILPISERRLTGTAPDLHNAVLDGHSSHCEFPMWGGSWPSFQVAGSLSGGPARHCSGSRPSRRAIGEQPSGLVTSSRRGDNKPATWLRWWIGRVLFPREPVAALFVDRRLIALLTRRDDVEQVCWQGPLQSQGIGKRTRKPRVPLLGPRQKHRHCLGVNRANNII